MKGRGATMAFLTELGEVLHEEHFRILSLICGLENRVIGAEGRRPIDPRDEEEKEHLQELIVSLDQIIDHNASEEAVLFPLICARGGGELASLLTHEHVIIGPLARRVRGIAARILEDGIDADRWAEFQSAATDLVAEMMAPAERRADGGPAAAGLSRYAHRSPPGAETPCRAAADAHQDCLPAG